jgi:hypothetical protein
METEIIAIRVDAEAARLFKTAPPEERRKLEALLSLRLSEITRPSASLPEIMREISRQAQARGLTPEILQMILNGE